MEIKKGIAVSPGVSIGKSLIVDSEDYRIPRREIEPSQRVGEIQRIRSAFLEAIEELISLERGQDEATGGHIKDIFTLTATYAKDPKLIDLVDSVIATVKRCAEVTRGLLNFSRHLNLSIQTIHLPEVIDEVKGVLAKETDFRSISVDVKVSEDIPPFESDRGKLEQVFFNLFNNAIGNIKDGGHLEIEARREDSKLISISFSDNGPALRRQI